MTLTCTLARLAWSEYSSIHGDDGLQLRVECVGLAFNSITYNVKKDQETITIPKPTGKGNVVNVSLISKNIIADSYKFIQ